MRSRCPAPASPLSPASDHQALGSQRSTRPWCQKGRGPLADLAPRPMASRHVGSLPCASAQRNTQLSWAAFLRENGQLGEVVTPQWLGPGGASP